MKIKYFPCAPRIPWQIDEDKYIIPKLSASLFQEHLRDKNAIIVCYGGLLESYFSFYILEVINNLFPSIALSWVGHEKYRPLCEMNRLARFDSSFDPELLKEYPLPLFFDKQNNAYFNCLNNYLSVRSYYKKARYCDHRLVLKQLVEKSLIPFNYNLLPKIRKNLFFKDLDQIIKSPFIIIVPERTSHTIHKIKCLPDWNFFDIRSLASILKYKNINTVIFTENPSKYYGGASYVLPIKLEYLFYLLPKAVAVLSYDIDFLFIASAISSAKIFTTYNFGRYSLSRNKKFLHKKNVIYHNKQLSLEDVIKEL